MNSSESATTHARTRAIASSARRSARGRIVLVVAAMIVLSMAVIFAFHPSVPLRFVASLTAAASDGDVQPADAIVVLGGDEGRLPEGLRLYEEGFADELWQTGGNHAQVTKQPADGIVRRVLPSTTTWEDGIEIRKAIEETGAKRLIIVTSWYHGRRAMRSIEKQTKGLDVRLYYRPVATQGYDQSNWWCHARGRRIIRSELLKSLYYAVVYRVPAW